MTEQVPSKDLLRLLRMQVLDRHNGSEEAKERLMLEAADEIDQFRRQVNLAWAAGLFEGEGAICGAQKYKNRRKPSGERILSGYRWWLVIHSTDHDVLRRFSAIVGAGRFYGPYKDRRSDKYKPQLRWATTTLEETQRVLSLLLPHLGERRKAKALECMEASYVRKRTA